MKDLQKKETENIIKTNGMSQYKSSNVNGQSQHIIPHSFLKNYFHNESNVVTCYMDDTQKMHAKKRSEKDKGFRNIKKLTQNEFYNNPFNEDESFWETKFSQDMEPQLASIQKKIIDSEIITNEEKQKFAFFMSILFARSSYVRELTSNHIKENYFPLINNITNEYISNSNLFKKFSQNEYLHNVYNDNYENHISKDLMSQPWTHLKIKSCAEEKEVCTQLQFPLCNAILLNLTYKGAVFYILPVSKKDILVIGDSSVFYNNHSANFIYEFIQQYIIVLLKNANNHNNIETYTSKVYYEHISEGKNEIYDVKIGHRPL